MHNSNLQLAFRAFCNQLSYVYTMKFDSMIQLGNSVLKCFISQFIKKGFYVHDSKVNRKAAFNHKWMRQQSFELYCESTFKAHSSMLCINNFNYAVLRLSESGISDLHIYDTCQILRLVKSISSCLYFEYRFHYYKYMLTKQSSKISVLCSYICNLSRSANFPSSSYYSNYSSYPWSSLCISPISFI